MTHRYWIVGGDYADCNFARITPGTETMAGPFADEGRARTEWQRLTFRDRCNATTRYSIAVEPQGIGQ
ncbi:hypothetical protein [Sphingomonas sp. LY160]|uniref:DUF4170 domain-containing protein n=1 Tax=Sphingomonas sp. LY160 TaxID=3095342 RepID=UPI002ADEE4D7|nr:hypothetical protein [Sphingomonas sp. LY160]MEA1072379.1 hypothetical protein [Sphingomonas sp. LY160]